jgi:hypothetical protein
MTNMAYLRQKYKFTGISNKVILDIGVGPNDDAVVLLASPEAAAEALSYVTSSNGVRSPRSLTDQPYTCTVLHCSGRKRTRLDIEVDIAFPSVQPIIGGGALIVGARCSYKRRSPDQNAAMYDAKGSIVRRMVLGDGIRSVQVDQENRIWVSYFDEGIFGNRGWNEPIGGPGLLRWDMDGRITWSFEPPIGFDMICDCYALNVAVDAAWACYYTTFPVVRVGRGDQISAWVNGVDGVGTLAVDDERILLWGGYGDDRTRCVVRSVAGDQLGPSRWLDLRLPDGGDLSAARVIGRGPVLHAFAGDSWYTFDLRELK